MVARRGSVKKNFLRGLRQSPEEIACVKEGSYIKTGCPEYDRDEWSGITLAEASVLSFELPLVWSQDIQYCT